MFLDTTREAFRVAHDVSAYSLVALARGAAPLMTEGGSIVAMTLLRFAESCAALQRDGRGQGRAGGQHALSGLRSGPEENPRQLHQRRSRQHAGRARHRRFFGHAQALRGARAAQTQRRCPTNWAPPGSFWPATARRPSRARCFTWTAATRSWGCSPRMELDGRPQPGLNTGQKKVWFRRHGDNFI